MRNNPARQRRSSSRKGRNLWIEPLESRVLLSGNVAAAVEPATAISTTTVLTASLPSTKFGQAVTFTATVTPASDIDGAPTGSVTFNYGDIVLGTTALNGGGVATLALSTLPVSPDTIVATYNATAAFTGSVSNSIVEPVAAASTTTTLVPSLTTAAPGELVVLTALVNSVAPGSGLPTTGAVVFTEGETVLGSNTLNSQGATFIALTTLPPGANSIVATYTGVTDYAASASSAGTVTVTQPVTTKTSLATSLRTTKFGQPVTFTATVTPSSDIYGAPTGTVTFTYGDIVLGTTALSGGATALTITTLPVSADTIVATYNGAPAFDSSASPSIVVPVTAAATTTTVVPSLTQAGYGDLVVLTALVNPVAPGGGVPTSGAVVFTDNGFFLGSNNLNSQGATFIALKTLFAGSNSIVATYGGSIDYLPSTSPAVTVTVRQQVITTTTLATSLPSTKFGQPVTFTAAVTAASEVNGTPSGTVTFNYGDIALGTTALNGSGVATLTINTLPVSADTVVATYNGAPQFDPSRSLPIVVPVAPAATTTTLVPSLTTAGRGQLVVLTALVNSVAPGGGLPTSGTVIFTEGTAILGSNTLNSQGATFIALSTLLLGSNPIVATYIGTTDYLPSISPAKTVTVIPSITATTTKVTASAANPVLGQALTVTATVAPVGLSVQAPTGTVTFIEDGSVTLGTATLNSSGIASMVLAPGLFLGLHSVTAVYSGATTFAASTSTGVLVNVTLPATTTSGDGLQTATIQAGSGPGAVDDDTLQINYTGYLSDGIIFSSSLLPGQTPLAFTLGSGEVVAGLDQGLVGARVGETLLLIVPPSLAYGSAGSGVIPPNETLYFVVTLLAQLRQLKAEYFFPTAESISACQGAGSSPQISM